MPSGRPKKQRTVVPDAQDSANDTKLDLCPQRGFVGLPLEIHFMILQQYPVILKEDILVNPLFIEQPTSGFNYLDRLRVTRVLSQTCRSLRALYLPICWERIQACMRVREEAAWYRDFSLGIQHQAKGLLHKSPHLLVFIRTVTVCLTRAEKYKSLPLLAELLENLPNLESIQVPHAHGSMGAAILSAFSNKTFPTVRSVILPNAAGSIIRSCPNVVEVVCNEFEGGRLVTSLIESCCDKVEVLAGITPGVATLKRLARLNVPLRRIRVGCEADKGDSIKRFSCFPSLRVIEINCSERNELGLLPGFIKAAKETLEACQTFDYLPKSASAKAKQEATAARERLANLYPEPRLVRVRYLPGQKPRKDYPHEDPGYFFPSRTEEFLI